MINLLILGGAFMRLFLIVLIMICRFIVFLFPIKFLFKVGRALGLLCYYLIPKRRRITLINLKLCFPELSDKKRKDLAKKCFENMGLGLFEALCAWFKPKDKLFKLKFKIYNDNYLNKAREKKQGIMFLCGHFTCVDILAQLLSDDYEYNFIYRPHDNLYIDNLIVKGRQRFGHKAIRRDDIRAMLTCLKNAGSMINILDQDMGPNSSDFVPFFGVQTATLSSILYKIAKRSDAQIIPAMFYREADGEYVLKYYEPLVFDNNLTEEQKAVELAKNYNQILESTVREYPDQYLWAHRRFKTRPKGEDSFY